MIPLRDVIPSRTTPYVNFTLIGLNVLVFVYEMSLGDALEPFIESFALIPAFFSWTTVFTSMFLHGGLLHVGGNMLFLWIFGNNIEDVMGSLSYVGFYLLSGLVAAAAHIAVQPNSTVPVVGASGAIAGVMGAYMVLFPNVRIRTVFILIFFFFLRDIRAKYLLGFWFLLQFFTNPAEGVAWVAHVGGFVFGAIVGFFLRERLRPRHASWVP